MYQSAETHPTPSQASKINIFVKIINVFRLTLLTIFAKSIFAFDLYQCRQLIKSFRIHE